MNAYCHRCETELDQATGICPACRWDPAFAPAQAANQPQAPAMSLTERYRGSEYDVRANYMGDLQVEDRRGRTFVLMGVAVAAGISALALTTLGALSL